MKRILKVVILVATLGSCSRNQGNPDDCFTPEQRAALILQCVRYSAKLPPRSNHTIKFKPEFDWYYEAAAEEYDWRKCVRTDSGYYFLMTRKARSIWPAREAIGGRLTVDQNGKLQDYEEIFRTWKMTEDTLNARAFELFDLMVDGKDLTPYRSKYKGDRYIEFPDDNSYFSKPDKRWRTRSTDSLMQRLN